MKKSRFGRLSAILMLACLASNSLAQEAPVPASQPAESPQAPGGLKLADMTIDQLMRLAELARQNSRFADAVKLANLVAQREGGQRNIDVLRLLGEIAFDMGNAEDAKKNWMLVRKVQPSDFGANWGLGRLNLRSGQYRSAAYYMEIAEQVAPADRPELKPLLLIKLAQAYQGSGLQSQAVAKAEEALREDPLSMEAWFVVTKLRSDMARSPEAFDRAMGDADRAIEIAENEAKAKGLSRETLQGLQYAYQLKLSVLYSYRTILFEQNPDGSLSDQPVPDREMLIAETMNSAVDVMLRQADLARLEKHFTIAELAKSVTEFDGGDNPATLLKLGALQSATGQYAEAEATLQLVLALDPENEDAHRQLEAVQAQLPIFGSPE